MEDTTVQMRIEARVEGGALRGAVHADGGATLEFSGWLGLIAALDALLATPEAESSTLPA